jgi:nitrogen fixation NifU-like protein
MDRLDRFIDELQTTIFDEAKAAYGEKGCHRWRHPRHQGRMGDFDACGRVKGQCGDTMEIYLKFQEGCVADASYWTDGCASSDIAASFAVELVLGRDVDALTDINGDAVLDAVGRMPDEDRHCADLAAATVQQALHNYMRCRTR